MSYKKIKLIKTVSIHFFKLITIDWTTCDTCRRWYNEIIQPYIDDIERTDEELQEYIDDDLIFIRKIIELLEEGINNETIKNDNDFYLDFTVDLIKDLKLRIILLEEREKRQYERWLKKYLKEMASNTP